MRITYLHQYFNTTEMSGGTRSFEMARRLVSMGHDVNMVTSWREPDGRTDWFSSNEQGINVHWLPVLYSNHMSYQQRLASFSRFAWRAALKAGSLPADVVYATSTPLTIALPGIYAARRQKVPMIFEVRDLWPEVPIALGALSNPFFIDLARRLERWAYKNSAEVVALAPGMKEGVVKAGYSEAKVSVIPNGADIVHSFGLSEYETAQIRSNHDWLGARPLLVYAGAFGHVNDLDFMIDLAVSVLEFQPNVRFVAIGDGARFAAVKRRAEQKGILGKTFFLLGRMTKNDVLLWLAAADAHLVLYNGPRVVWKDCVSNKLFDAMAAGKPIISNIPGWGPLLAQQYGAGIILDGQNADQAATVLVAYLQDKKALLEAGEKSRELGSERFCRDKLASELEQVLVRVAGKN